MMVWSRVVELVVAQAGGSQGSPAGGIIGMVPLVLMGLVFYFLIIRPTSKQRKEHKELLNALKKNDEVVTNGGFYGRIISIDDRVATLELADKVKVRILIDRIQGRWVTSEQASK